MSNPLGYHSRLLPMRKRFEDKFSPEPNSGCWIWMGACQRRYGKFRLNGNGNMRAHRASWVMYRGDIPKGQDVLHRCDVPLCVNPDHLFLGNQSTNMADMNQKGRQAKGETNGISKLTEDQVHYLKSLGRLPRQLADELSSEWGVGWKHLYDVRRGRCWRHV